jgi:hypothetical protein
VPHGDGVGLVPHDTRAVRAYRWNEDGIAGVCDRHQQELCLGAGAVERTRSDPQGAAVRADRQRGQSRRGRQGATTTTSTPRPRTRTCGCSTSTRRQRVPLRPTWWTRTAARPQEPEYELIDTGVFDEHRYFDVFVEYAKATRRTCSCGSRSRIGGRRRRRFTSCPRCGSATRGRGADDAERPAIRRLHTGSSAAARAETRRYGGRDVHFDGAPDLLFTENDTNTGKLFGTPDGPRFAKDGFHEAVVHGRTEAVNADGVGTKAAAHYAFDVPAGGDVSIRVRMRRAPADTDDVDVSLRTGSTRQRGPTGTDAIGTAPGTPASGTAAAPPPFDDFDAVMATRQAEADAFYDAHPAELSADARLVMRQAFRRDALDEAVLPLRRATRPSRRRPSRAPRAATTTGATSTTPTSSRCPTSGSTRGTRRGTWPSTASRWRWSTRSSPSSSSC